MIFLLLIAGHETTVNLIGNGVLSLLDNPDSLEQLRSDPGLIGPAVRSCCVTTARCRRPPSGLPSEDVTIAGATIPRGEMVFAVVASANRDEQQFADPDTLDLTREPNRHLAFGLGIHYCLGPRYGAEAGGTDCHQHAALEAAGPAAWRCPRSTALAYRGWCCMGSRNCRWCLQDEGLPNSGTPFVVVRHREPRSRNTPHLAVNHHRLHTF